MTDPTEPEERDGIDPERLRQELGRYVMTACRYALRQGMSHEELMVIADLAKNPTSQFSWAAPTPERMVLIPVPELLGRGISDMRGKH